MSPISGISSSATERDVPVVPDTNISYAPPAPVSSTYILTAQPADEPGSRSK